MDVKVKWRSDLGDMTIEGVGPSGRFVIMDSSPEFGGNNQGPRPMETLLIALGGCTAMDILSILRKKKQEITSLEIQIIGEKAKDYPKEFKKVELKYIVAGKNLDQNAVKQAVELSQDQYCGVSATLKKQCEISYSFEVKEG